MAGKKKKSVEVEEVKKKVPFAKRFVKKYKSDTLYLANDESLPITVWIDSGCYVLNLIISGDPFLGYPGNKITQYAGMSSSGKSYLAIEAMKKLQEAGYTLFYIETEGANEPKSLEKRGINLDNVVFKSASDIKEVHKVCLEMLEEKEPDDKIAVIIDSWGNLASEKEYEYGIKGENTQHLSKNQLNFSFFRTYTNRAAMAEIPTILINHVYLAPTTGGDPTRIAGGNAPYFNSSCILQLTKQVEHEGDKKHVGSGVGIKAYKNRLAMENKRVRIVINYKKGISKYSGLFQLAYDYGWIEMPSNGWYVYKTSADAKPYVKATKKEPEPKNPGWSEKKVQKKFFAANADLWEHMLRKAGFREKLCDEFQYQSSTGELFDDSDYDPDTLETNTGDDINETIKETKKKKEKKY